MSSSYITMQCAAVSTHWELISVPPQMWKLTEAKCRLTCQGHDPAVAFAPPTTLVFRGACPQSDKAKTAACQHTKGCSTGDHRYVVGASQCVCGMKEEGRCLPWAFDAVRERERERALQSATKDTWWHCCASWRTVSRVVHFFFFPFLKNGWILFTKMNHRFEKR